LTIILQVSHADNGVTMGSAMVLEPNTLFPAFKTAP